MRFTNMSFKHKLRERDLIGCCEEQKTSTKQRFSYDIYNLIIIHMNQIFYILHNFI